MELTDALGSRSRAPEEAGVLSLLWDVLTVPDSALRAAARGGPLVPLVAVISMVNVLVAWASLEPAKGYSLLLVEQAGKTLTPDKEYIVLMTVTVATLTAGLVSPWMIWLFESVLIRLVGLFVDRTIGFKRILRVVTLAGIPMILGFVVKAVLVNLRPEEDFVRVQAGLVFLAPEASADSPLYFVLSHLDPFGLWSLALLALGLARLYRVPVKRGALGVGIGWGLYLALLAGLQFWPG